MKNQTTWNCVSSDLQQHIFTDAVMHHVGTITTQLLLCSMPLTRTVLKLKLQGREKLLCSSMVGTTYTAASRLAL